MTPDPSILVASFGTLATLWAAWLTFRSSQAKVRQEAQAHLYVGLSEEVQRLRTELHSKDDQARENYEEILALRKDMNEAQSEIHGLQLELTKWTAGALLLYRQVLEADLEPHFIPSKETFQ